MAMTASRNNAAVVLKFLTGEHRMSQEVQLKVSR